MKKYIQPHAKAIELYEEIGILYGSDQEKFDIKDQYADEALSNKRNMWDRNGIWDE